MCRPCADRPRLLGGDSESIGRGRIERALPSRGEGHALRSDDGKGESQIGALMMPECVFVTPLIVCHVPVKAGIYWCLC